MQQDPIIDQHVHELRRQHGAQAIHIAEEKMRSEMDKGDVATAGIWLSVMYELSRAEA